MGVAPSTESMAMAAGVWSAFQESKARLLVLPAIAIAGCAAWLMLPGPSDAQNPDAQNPPAQTPASPTPGVPPPDPALVPPPRAAPPTRAAAPADAAPVETPA